MPGALLFLLLEYKVFLGTPEEHFSLLRRGSSGFQLADVTFDYSNNLMQTGSRDLGVTSPAYLHVLQREATTGQGWTAIKEMHSQSVL